MANRGLRIFRGATAVVTGSASGIGQALAEALARQGAEVIMADLQLEQAEKIASAIRDAGGRAWSYQIDVRDYSAVDALLQTAIERTGRLDFVFNNAGIGLEGPVELYELADWQHIVQVNLWGVIHGAQAAYPRMLKQGFGHIVNTASTGGLQPTPGLVAYGTTKAGVVGLSLSLRAEAALAGIRVSVLCPGAVRTPLLDGGGRYGKTAGAITTAQQQARWEKLRPVSPEYFAQRALSAIAHNQAIIVIPWWWRVFWWLNRLSPEVGIFLAQQQYRDMRPLYLGK